MSKKSICKRSYRRAGNLIIEDRAEGVKTGIYTNAATVVAPRIARICHSTIKILLLYLSVVSCQLSVVSC
jgi:hypothetical protein